MTALPAQFTEWLKASNERFARFSGSQFSPHELLGGPPHQDKAAVRQATKLCVHCRKREVKLRQKYCPVCRKTRVRESKRKHMRRKRGLDVEELANSPIATEALTKPETQSGNHHPKTSIRASSFSTRDARALRHEPR
jgi:hypothetical protein